MLIVYVAVALLALAVCVLFAMVGELATRVLKPEEIRPIELPEAQPIEKVKPGVRVASVPGPLLGRPGEIAAPEDFGIVVLTTVCTSCGSFARELSRSPKAAKLPTPLYVLISAPNREKAHEFAAETGVDALANITVLYDELGQWCHSGLGLNVAPSFLRVSEGQVRGAWQLQSFRDIPVLWEPAIPNTRVEERSASHVHPG
jgi:hypothetical protein